MRTKISTKRDWADEAGRAKSFVRVLHYRFSRVLPRDFAFVPPFPRFFRTPRLTVYRIKIKNVADDAAIHRAMLHNGIAPVSGTRSPEISRTSADVFATRFCPNWRTTYPPLISSSFSSSSSSFFINPLSSKWTGPLWGITAERHHSVI